VVSGFPAAKLPNGVEHPKKEPFFWIKQVLEVSLKASTQKRNQENIGGFVLLNVSSDFITHGKNAC